MRNNSTRRALVAACFVLALPALAAVPAPPGRVVRIIVLNGTNGRPITGECLNIGLGGRGPGVIVAPTNERGEATLRFAGGVVTADPAPRNRCSTTAVLGPVPAQRRGDALVITGDYFVPCQEYATIPEPEDAREAGPAARLALPRYSVAKILRLGIVASNTCGKARAKPKPGSLIFFERPMTFWEKLRL